MTRRKPRRPPGRPTALTEDLEKRLLDMLRAGVPITHAARANGITDRAVFKWLARGEDAIADHEETGEPVPDREQPFVQFVRLATRARSEGMARAVGLIQKAAGGGYVVRRTTRRYRDVDGRLVTETDEVFAPVEWRAAAWWLERADRDNFARSPQELQLSGPGGGPVEVSTQEFEGLAHRLRLNISQRTAGELASAGYVDGEVVDRAAS